MKNYYRKEERPERRIKNGEMKNYYREEERPAGRRKARVVMATLAK